MTSSLENYQANSYAAPKTRPSTIFASTVANRVNPALAALKRHTFGHIVARTNISQVENLVEKYNQAEREGRSTVSNRAIEAFGLEVFGTLGYPFKVNDESELWRYHDVMQEGRFDANLRLISKYTDHEFELITKTAKQILSFSERHLPIRNSGKRALTRSLYQYQLIMKNRPHDGPLKILEIGPGSGYLGLLLANDGHQYFAMDAAQAFYLYQKKLWSDIYGSDYFDYSESSSRPDSAKVTHIPWWRFANLAIPLPEVDIVTVNHALAEMHENAVKTIFARLYAMWGDDDKKLVIAESLGYDYFKRTNIMFTNICKLGFVYKRNQIDLYTWRPNKAKAQAELANAMKSPTPLSYLKKRALKIAVIALKNPLGANLAKLIGRGPRHQATVDKTVYLQTKPLRDFFENLVANERTPDEIFLKPMAEDII